MMRPIMAVVRREYVQRVRTKWFVFGTLGLPLMAFLFAVLPALMATSRDTAPERLAVADRTGVLFEAVEAELEASGLEVVRLDPTADLQELRRQVEAGTLSAFLLLDSATLETGRSGYIAGRAPSALRRVSLRGAAVRAALRERLGADAEEAERFLSGGQLEVEVLSDEQGELDQAAFVVTYAGTFLLYIVILFYSVAIMRSTLEEKTGRVVEVILSSIEPWHLMMGKIVGVGAVALTQLAVWGGLLVAGGLLGLPALLAARPELAELGNLAATLPGLGYVGYFLLFFLTGFFLFASIYAAVGAMVSTEQEAHQAQIPVTMLLIVPIIFLPRVGSDPTSSLALILSLVPFFSPILMFARAVGGAAPLWQVGLSVVLMLITIVAVARAAGRIYKVGILMTGKRPTVPELLRWLREA